MAPHPSEFNVFKYPELLKGTQYENMEPLSEEKSPDGKSISNPTPSTPSSSYTTFPSPLLSTPRGGFDVHIYYFQFNPLQTAFAKSLYERIRREFPELRIYKLWDRPIGPHPIAMFEINMFTPAQFGAFVPWLMMNRGGLSCLVHPNTEGENEVWDHTTGAVWLGEKVVLDISVLMPKMQEEGGVIG